ncbi:patatin-like phospholipase family protein [Spirosoma fluviale]|nr:patatin-like phospholipase family protein [Spirosoma fluviale]
MPDPLNHSDESSSPSFHLSDVLREEYAFINPESTDFSAGKTTAENADLFRLIDPTELIGKLEAERRYLEAKAGRNDNLLPTSNPEPSEKTHTETPYTRLAEWLAEKILTEDLIRNTLIAQAERPNLLTEEPWLLNAALRPYTRGLLKRYLEWKDGHKPKASHFSTAELNQLLLEDAFAEHIVPKEKSSLDAVFNKMRDTYQSALCLSGGGIRSATFALGVMQGLAQHNLLGRFSYLSTVSGGGYVGGWLSAWRHHEGLEKVITRLKTTSSTPIASEADPIRHLRQFSNYLSPQLGLFSADTWTLVATYMRNLLLIWLVILPFLAALTAVPWVGVTLASAKVADSGTTGFWIMGVLLVMAGVLSIMAVRFVHAYIPTPDTIKPPENKLSDTPLKSDRDQIAFINKCLLPFSVAVLLLILVWIWFSKLDPTRSHWASDIYKSLGLDQRTGLNILSAGGYWIMGGTMLAHVIGWLLAKPTPKKLYLQVLMFLVIALVGAIAGFLLLLTAKFLRSSSMELYTCLAFPCFMLAILLVGYLFEGVVSRHLDDARREWTARYSAWLLIAGLGWLVLSSVVLFGPGLVDTIKLQIASIGLGSGILTALLGGSAQSAGRGEGAGSRQGKGNASGIIGLLSSYSLPIAATLTIFILIVMLSLLNQTLTRLLADQFYGWFGDNTYGRVLTVFAPLFLLTFFLLAGWLLALMIDTNRFSLHAMYRARLIRAYLGASRPQETRSPDPFTGFDEGDNIPMGQLKVDAYPSPGTTTPRKPLFHIVNLALNLVNGQNLAWQERKAEAFSISPLHAGAMNLGYRRTRDNAGSANVYYQDQEANVPTQKYSCYGGKKGISLGTAITISGAAASPNMGYHSSTLVAFLMTLFNVRLGWWLGNPGPAGDKTFDKSTPTLAVKPIWDELRANTDDTNEYVYLSDGGHFENLGLYEMVLRRNRFIVVSDAGCDESCTLEDLGNAIRKIRIDLGIPIEFQGKFQIQARSTTVLNTDGKYWALARIGYSAVDKPAGAPPNDVDGLLLYIKPAFYGNEPRDIFNYGSTKSAFPHESTSDQFFSESQFESYRALGRYAFETIYSSFEKETGVKLDDLFTKDGLARHWEHINAKSQPTTP